MTVLEDKAVAQHVPEPQHRHFKEIDVVPLEQEAVQDAVHIDLGWRSWLVVFITCFA